MHNKSAISVAGRGITCSGSLLVLMILLLPSGVVSQSTGHDMPVHFVSVDAEDRIDVYMDNRLFTSYNFPANLEKPVLFPLLTSSGIAVTRGWPLKPRPGERVDHPHQVGWWFNYGDVNGIDFWGNSFAIPDSDKADLGRIRHRKVVSTREENGSGTLVVQCDWVDSRNQVVLTEETMFHFTGDTNRRRVTRTTQLTAVVDEVRFGDTKEGMCALRVDRAFETPSETPEIFTDASGHETQVAVLDNEGVNGVYRSSTGIEKDAVWGTRAPWVSLSAVKNGEPITLVLFDHPQNPGHPAHWHARGYGLFSVNNIGQKAFDPAANENEILLKKGQKIVFRHQLLIANSPLSHEEINLEQERFSGND